ncbi:hypothetical protein [Pseudolysinimonas sp.]|jgi:hypothetical protein|uniref:hypothetical protein n=1 Tax=Pseudolysinimonas sp. TaxID=2680009 RepID=UPI003784E222
MRRVVGAVAVLGMLALSGCGGGDPLPTLPPTPSSTPVFASEEEALAAAEAAYSAYLEMSNLISSEGGVDPERIAPFVTADQLSDELDGFAYFADNDIRSVGSSRVTRVLLQQYGEVQGDVEITFYACVDVSNVVIVDGGGNDVTPVDRDSLVALEVSMTGDSDPLLVSDSDQWSDSQFCFS